MSAERRIAIGACLLCAGIIIGCVQAWLAVSGRAPALSGLSLLALGLGGLGAGLMLTADGSSDPAGVGAAPVPRGPAGASGAAASVPTPDPAVDDGAGAEGAEEVLAAAARIVDGAVAGEAEAVVARIHGQPHSHLRLVLTPDDDPDGDAPEMLCELTAPLGAMGLAAGTLAQLMHDPHHVAEILEHLAHVGDASAASLLESLTSDGGEW